MLATGIRCFLIWSAYLLLSCLRHPVSAQDADPTPAPWINPRVFGLDIPPGDVVPGTGQRVLTDDGEGNVVVARVHVRVGNHTIVMIPDGRLVTRSRNQAQPTERPFVPATKDELVTKLTSNDFAGFKTKTTRRYLFVYNTGDLFATATSRIMESMFRGVVAYAENQRIDVHHPRVPLVVIMFRTNREFQAYQRMDPGIGAYYNTVTNRVVMKEESSLGKVNPELGIQQSITNIAHEGAHQILHNIGVQQRLSIWPMWISEGSPEHLAPTSTDRNLKWKGAGKVNDLRMFELEQYLKARPGDTPVGEMVRHTVGAGRLTSTGYATAWALTHYLAENHRAQFNRYVNAVSKREPLMGTDPSRSGGLISDNIDEFVRHFDDDFAGLERRVIAHLKQLPYNDPFAKRPHYVAIVSSTVRNRPQRTANVFHTRSLARKWRGERLQQIPQKDRDNAVSQIRVFANRAIAEDFARKWLRGG